MIEAQATGQLEALPTEVRRGSSLAFHARLLEPTTHAQLVVLEPTGNLRTIAAELDGQQVNARFYVDSPGVHSIQLVVDLEGGPAAALEAWVAVEQPLPKVPFSARAPGETASVTGGPPEGNLAAMLNAARRTAGLAPLARSSLLDQLARTHAAAMQRAGQLAHDVGEGNPLWRVQAAGVVAKMTGENLARAPSIERAHRAIWKSPAHRANLMAAHFDTVGIGVIQDQQQQFWVCELLTDEH
jgi:uncharacterized protein YkwD